MIVHLDADAFFASVEQAADVRLRGKPVAVGGLHRGVVASASYEARKLGIYTTMPTARARKLCPKLIVVPGDFEKYERFSRLMFSYAFDFTPDVEISSIDEGYFDLGGNRRRPPGEVAEIIARAIRDSLKISVSEGVGSNKLIAQVASKLRKPAALIEVPAGEEKTFLNPLENRWLPGVGPRAAIELNSAGLRWIGQIAATPPEILSVVAGNGAPQLWRFANGVDDRPVVPEPPDAKSYGRQETFEQDVTDEAFILATLRQMTDRLMAKARGDRKSVRTVTVKIRYNDMEECSRSVSLEEPTHLESDVYAVLGDLLKKAWTRRVSLRLVSVKLSHVYDGVFAPELPLDPPTRARHNRARLVPAIDEVRQRIGRDALMRGHDLWLREREGKPRVATDRPGACQLSRRRAPAPRQVSLPPPLLLNVKSYYSLLDSTLSLPEIVARAAASGAKTIAVTDPNLYGAIEFYSLAKAAGLRPIIAAEVSCSGRRWNLYVKNAAGYRNLCRILSQSVLRPEFLADHAQGLIRADPDDPRLFLPEIRYAKPEHRRRYDVIQSIRTLTMLDEAHPEKRRGGEFHFPGPDRLAAAERKDPAAWRAAAKLAEACEFEFEPPRLRFPRFHPPDGTSAHVFLRRLAEEGWNRRYPNGHHAHALSRAQLEQELAIIERVGYEEYFLSAWEILQECRARGIPWLTRGSAADSLVCYCLEISDVCPIRFDLYFRRFLNEARMKLQKLPDIDIDFPHDRKDDVVDLLFEKYGPEHAAVVGGFSTYRGRGAIADVAKVLGVSDFQARRFTERIDSYTGAGELEETLKTRLESSDLPWRDEPFATAVKMAAALDGFPRHPQMHPCGVVLSRDPILDLTPVFHSAKGYPTTHFDMDAVEAVGLVKMDILAQAGLAVMRDATAMLRERGVEIDLKELEPWEDSAIWEMVARGEARGVHHIESPAMTSLAKMSEVRDIDRLIALVSVIRPGAANNAKKVQFARRLHGLEPVEYPHPSLEPVLASTYGVVAYEEHILQICEAFAGMDAGRADLLRRALTKEQPEKITPLGRDFCEAARALGRSQADIEAVWTLVAGFQGYAFCRAHSTAYGVEAYQAAYLKRYHPAEFLSCVLTHGKGFYDRLTYTLESRRLGMTFAPPDVNESSDAFSVEREAGSGKRIRVPRTVIKEMTEATLERWRAERARGRFDSIEDFYARVRPGLVEMTNLVRLGAFDSFGAARTEQFWKLRHLANWPMERGQAMLFSREPFRLPEVPLAEPTRLERLRAEMELLSFTVSGHPLELYPDIPWSTYCPVAELGRHRGERVTIAGLIIADRLFHQVDGREMKFLTICDPSGMIEAELFASVYRRYGLTTVRYPVVEITATVQPFEQTKSFSLNVQEVRRPRGWTGWAADAA